MPITINHGLDAGLLAELATTVGRKNRQRQQAGNVLQFMVNRQQNAARVRAAFFGGGSRGRSRGGSAQQPELSATDTVFKHKAQQENLEALRLANKEVELTNEAKALKNDLYTTDLEKEQGMNQLAQQGRAFQEKLTPEKMQLKTQDDFLATTLEVPGFEGLRAFKDNQGNWKYLTPPKEEKSNFSTKEIDSMYQETLDEISFAEQQKFTIENPDADPVVYKPTEADKLKAKQMVIDRMNVALDAEKSVLGIVDSAKGTPQAPQPHINPHSTGVAKNKPSANSKALGFTGNTLTDTISQKEPPQPVSVDETSLNSPDRQPGVIPEFPTGVPELMAIESGVTPDLFTQVKRMEELGLPDDVIVNHIKENTQAPKPTPKTRKTGEKKGVERFISSRGKSQQRLDVISKNTTDKVLQRIADKEKERKEKDKKAVEKRTRDRVFKANKKMLKELGVDNFNGTPEEAVALILKLRTGG